MMARQILIFGTRFNNGCIHNAMSGKSFMSIFRSFLKSQIFMIKSCYCKTSSSQGQSSDKTITSENKIMLEKYIAMLKYEGFYTPKLISDEHFLELSELPTKGMKIKFLDYLYKRELAKEENKIKKEERKKLYKIKFEEKRSKSTEHIDYGLWKNSMFIKARKTEISSFFNNRLAIAMKFNQPLVLDLGFYDHMSRKEVYSLATQLQLCITNNRIRPEPLNLTLCNVDFDCQKFQIFSRKCMPNVLQSDFPLNITSKSYLDLFPKEKLIYLSPDSNCDMQTFDCNAIYIIGGIVDEGRTSPITLAKAKRENIKTEKLPLDRYHVFKRSKSLDIDVVVNILLDLQKDGDWEKACKHIPRKLLQNMSKIPLHPKKNRKF